MAGSSQASAAIGRAAPDFRLQISLNVFDAIPHGTPKGYPGYSVRTAHPPGLEGPMVDAVFGLDFLFCQQAVGIVGGCRKSTGVFVRFRHDRPHFVCSLWSLIDQKMGNV